MMDYYYADASGQPAGPVAFQVLCQWLASGNLLPTVQVVEAGGTVWRPLDTLIMLRYTGADGQAAGPVPLETLLRQRAAGKLQSDSWVLPESASQWVPLNAVVPAHLQPVPVAAGPAARSGARQISRNVRPVQGARGMSRQAYALTVVGLALLQLGIGVWLVYRVMNGTVVAGEDPLAGVVGMGSVLLGILVGIGMMVMTGMRIVNIGWSGWLVLLMFVPVVSFLMMIACLLLPARYAEHGRLDSGTAMGAALMALTLVAAVGGGVVWWRINSGEVMKRFGAEMTEARAAAGGNGAVVPAEPVR
jgi:hypothetical protein